MHATLLCDLLAVSVQTIVLKDVKHRSDQNILQASEIKKIGGIKKCDEAVLLNADTSTT